MDSCIIIDPLISQAERLCDLGLYLQVQPMLESLEQHPSLYGRLIGTRAAAHLGARRRAESQVFRLWRAHPGDPWVAVAFLRSLTGRRGPYQAWRHLSVFPNAGEVTPKCLADFHSLRAYLLGNFRDFRQARLAYSEARRSDPEAPWPLVEWCSICELGDRYDEGLAVAEEALDLHPGYRPAIQAKAQLQSLVGRDDEALALLREAALGMESGAVHAQLVELLIENGLYRDAWETLDRCAELHPLADKTITTWLAARRADVALRLDRLKDAKFHAVAVGTNFYRRIADRLGQEGGAGRRVLLPVGFVRQHYRTCAPATLAALSNYWSHSADHLEIAELICYDGTPNHSERQWAENQGFIVREFTVDWETACALIDSGVPFTLTTTWPGGAHLQAVIGYDELRGTLLIRDPFKRVHGEFEAQALFESHLSNGPRGMVLLPQAEGHRLTQTDLPDAPIWDGYYDVMSALSRHDRDAAVSLTKEIEDRYHGHRLALAVRRALAMYDGDEVGLLAATDELLGRFPTDTNLQLSKAASLSLLANRAKQIEWLAAVAGPAGAEPLAVLRYAQLLGQDGREAARAEKLIRHILDRMPTDASAWHTHANLLWQQMRKEPAIEHYRIAACLQDTDEGFAVSYFRASHFVRSTEPALEFLRERVDRWRQKSTAPIMTLFGQLEMLGRTDEAFRMLDESLDRHFDDADLLLFSAEAKLRYSMITEATALLDRAQGRTKRATWLRLRAQLARENGDCAAALVLAREASTLEPLNLVLHRLMASLLARNMGRSQAVGYLREMAARFDHHFGLHELLIEWLAEEPLSAVEAVLRHMVKINPSSVWALRELAINVARQHRHDEAMELMAAVREMADTDSYTHSTLGFVRLHQGRTTEGRQHLRDALALSIDNDYALNALVDTGTTLAQRQEALDFVRVELVRQVTMGDSLLAFQGAAQRTLPPDEVLSVLREALSERPDLWQSWVALGSQLIDMGQTDEALDLIGRGIDRFPLLPRLRLEQGRALTLQGKRDAAREAYWLVLQINPQWTRAVRLFVDTVLDEGVGFERALGVLNAALARNPEDAELRGLKALVRWRNGDRPVAVTELPQALALDPRPNWMWNTLKMFGDEIGDRELPHRVAAELVQKRAGDVWSWIRSAEYAKDQGQALADIEHALALEPRNQAAYETRLTMLMRAGRINEVDAALTSHPWETVPPVAVQVFAARVARARDDMKEAFRRLRALIDADPNNYLLWEQLAEWCDEADHNKAYLDASQNLVRLAPNFHKAHGFLAYALLKLDERARARQHFERAFQLDPTYSFAGVKLVDCCLDDGDAVGAENALATLARLEHNVFVTAREVRLAVLKGDQEAASSRLPEILRSREGDWPITTAIDAFCGAGWQEILETEIEACFSTGRCAYAAVGFWLEQQGGGLIPGSFYRGIKRRLANDPEHALMVGLLDHAGAKKDARLLDRLMRDYHDLLATVPECWAMVSYGLLTTEQHKRVVTWMNDWRARPETPAWALDNLAVSLRTGGQHALAREVTLRSLELAPNNLDAKTWLAVDAARDDRMDELAVLLAEIAPNQVRGYYRNLLAALLAYHRGVSARDSAKTLLGFANLGSEKKQSLVLRQLMRTLGNRMVQRYTPTLLRPIRWLQFALV